MGGPSVWSSVIHPPVTPAVESAIWKAIRTDPGETSPWIQFLLYKQSLDPARFAHYHPKLSPALDRLSASPTAAQVLTPDSSTTLHRRNDLTPDARLSRFPSPRPGSWPSGWPDGAPGGIVTELKRSRSPIRAGNENLLLTAFSAVESCFCLHSPRSRA